MDDLRSTKAGALAPATPNGTAWFVEPDGDRSTKAGALAPATLLNSAKGRRRDETSLFRGRVSLDDDAFEAISRDCEQYFVSMISAEQLKLP